MTSSRSCIQVIRIHLYSVGHDQKCHGLDDQHVHYLQSQNGNLYSGEFFSNEKDSSEFAVLRADVPPEVNFVRDALGPLSVRGLVVVLRD